MFEKEVEKLKKAFGVETLILEEWRDKYGKLINVKELGITQYKKSFTTEIDRIIEEYEYANSEEALKELKAFAEKDNLYARFLNKREYEVVKVYTRIKPYLSFGALIRFMDNGETRYVFETGLCYKLSGRWRKEGNECFGWHYRESYFTAGGLRDKEVDFIFHGVGHSSKNDLYSATSDEVLNP